MILLICHCDIIHYCIIYIQLYVYNEISNYFIIYFYNIFYNILKNKKKLNNNILIEKYRSIIFLAQNPECVS